LHYKALLFDMDGVVIDSREYVERFWNTVAEKHQVKLTPADFVEHVYGCPAQHTLEHLFGNLTKEEQERVYELEYEFEKNQQYKEIKGVVDFLRRLRQLDVPTALVTSSEYPKIDEVFKQLHLEGLFRVIVSIEDIQRGKPHPDCYFAAAQKLQLAPGECIVFEDSISGTEAAIATGAACIGVQGDESIAARLMEKGAKKILRDFSGMTPQQLPNMWA
jgi:HAD superfamily hydrolase (TIGR01509 family)